MTNPGDIERVATKVVPYYVVGVVEDEEIDGQSQNENGVAPEPATETTTRRQRPTWVGYIAAVFGLATVVLFVISMIVSAGGDYFEGTMLAYSTIVMSISAAITGILCLILGLQRRWAAFGLALGILANPLLVLIVFRFFGG